MRFAQLNPNRRYRVLDDRLAPHEYVATGAEIVRQVRELGWDDDGDYQIEPAGPNEATMPMNEETPYTLGRLLVNRIRANNGGVVPNPVTPAHIKRALSELNRDTSEEMMRLATAQVQRQGVPVSGPVMGESAADVLINGALRGLPIREGLRLIRRPFAGSLDEDAKGDLDAMRDKLDKLASKQSDPKAKEKLQDIRKQLGAAKDIVESIPGVNSFDVLPPDELAVAKKMYAKGYAYGVQFVNPDGTEFGAPLYFKSPMQMSQFMRDNPELKQEWLVQLNARDNNPFAESFREADDGDRKAAEAMAKNAGKKPGDDDWEETVKKFEKNAGKFDKKESRLREGRIPSLPQDASALTLAANELKKADEIINQLKNMLYYAGVDDSGAVTNPPVPGRHPWPYTRQTERSAVLRELGVR